MNATARDLPKSPMDETVAHVPSDGPDPAPGPDAGRHAEEHAMPPETHQGRTQRYVFGSGARPLDGFTIKRAIGRGGFGEVYYATSDAGKEVALKLITRNLDVERRGVVQCMNLKSPNLIAVHDLRTSEAGDDFVIMEYVSGPSLAQVLREHPNGLPPEDVRAWLKGLVEGVAYLHDHGIVHRDLKPANLFMEEGIVKIGDYGLSKLISGSQGSGQSESVGTCHYMAPEIASGKYHKPIDIYAMGVIVYEMLTGRVPFEGETVGEVLMKHLTARPDVSMLPEPYRAIVAQALAKDPAARQARVLDMLGPDAPAAPDVRIIGDRRGGGANAPAGKAAKAKPAEEEVFRIEAEEPIFYIGPDTRPPRPAWGWRKNPVVDALKPRFRPAAQGRPAPPPARRPAPAPAARRPAPAPAPEPPPEPVELPDARVRVAEAASSMLWAAPVAGLLSVALGLLVFGDEMSARPQDVAALFGATLLGTWGALAPAKAFEGREGDPMARRITFMLVGLGIGGLLSGLAGWTLVQPGAAPRPLVIAADDGSWDFTLALPEALATVTFFGLAFLANGWWKLADRARPSRLRIWPVAWAALTGAALTPMFWPYDNPWGACALALTAVVVQLVSPWDEAAARYARYKAKAPKPSRAVA